jgi:hypothetical protein
MQTKRCLCSENVNWQNPQDRIAKNCCEALKQTPRVDCQYFGKFQLHRVHVTDKYEASIQLIEKRRKGLLSTCRGQIVSLVRDVIRSLQRIRTKSQDAKKACVSFAEVDLVIVSAKEKYLIMTIRVHITC